MWCRLWLVTVDALETGDDVNTGDLIVSVNNGSWIMSGCGELPNHSSHIGVMRIAKDGEVALVIAAKSNIENWANGTLWPSKMLVLIVDVVGNVGLIYKGNWKIVT